MPAPRAASASGLGKPRALARAPRDAKAFDRAIDVRITRIRRKIEPDPSHPTIIRTVRGAGYPDGRAAEG